MAFLAFNIVVLGLHQPRFLDVQLLYLEDQLEKGFENLGENSVASETTGMYCDRTCIGRHPTSIGLQLASNDGPKASAILAFTKQANESGMDIEAHLAVSHALRARSRNLAVSPS